MSSTGPNDKILNLSSAADNYLSKNGSIAIDALIKAYYNDARVKRIVMSVVRQFRLEDGYADELLQEMAILLNEKFIHTLVDSDKIYNVLHLTAINKARRYSMRLKEASLDVLLEKADISDSHSSVLMIDQNENQSVIDVAIDRKKAIREFNQRMKQLQEKEGNLMLKEGSLPTFGIDPCMDRRPKKLPPRKKLPSDGTPSKGGRELNEIRQEIGYTLNEFAQLLSCPKGTLSSYMYGSVQTVPDKLLDEARRLLEQSKDGFAAIEKAKFDAQSMQEIVAAWIKMLGNFPDEKSADLCLASVLSVDRATVWRWRTRNMRPESRKLAEYNKTINKYINKSR